MEHFTEACKNLNNGKLYQVSMDGPNVNLKFLRLLKEQIGSGVLHELIDIRSCNLHSISNLKPSNTKYNIRNSNSFVSNNIKTTNYGLETVSSLAPRIWEQIPEEIKQSKT